ncbi:hypothetical protein C8D94_1092 [Marinirhabdus gelatinilytica]|uniref:Uncharacterized protein n=1 Tax=Marinirhabdus gelatinilytica TaxID=1703343 RepID=A0A370Q3P2_9FLAO|nr:hypothetical protein C8D94_1092 [Marinirhabdus gelatinilytica]
MVRAHLQGRQIFKFGLLRKKSNKKNLKIRLVLNRMDSVQISPTILIQDRCGAFKKKIEIQKKLSESGNN